MPGSLIITPKKAYYSELQPLFRANPSLFSQKRNRKNWDGRKRIKSLENLLIAFLLYERQKGSASFWQPYLDILPSEPDCLLNWEKDELKQLQDELLALDAEREHQEMSKTWTLLRDCLLQYPSFFHAESISFALYKWAYIALYTRTFCTSKG